MSEVPFNPILELGWQLTKGEACRHHVLINRKVETIQEADQWWEAFDECPEEARREHLRFLAKNDLYFLLVYILLSPTDGEKLKRPWHFKIIRETQRNLWGIIDIGTRGSGKSLRKTFGLLIQEILRDPEGTHCILSHNRSTAHSFLKPVKEVFEKNDLLLELFPDVLYKNPRAESPSWSIGSGISVRRESISRPEATIEAYGLVDGLPTRKHYTRIWYDDIQQAPESPYMIEKINDLLQTSMGLSAEKPPVWTMTGVFFRGGSIYETLAEREFGLMRVRPAVNQDGSSGIWTDEEVAATKKLVTPGVWACEYLVDPTVKAQGEGFEETWLGYHEGIGSIGPKGVDLQSCHVYIIVDPGFGKKGKGSKTSINVVALTPFKKYCWVDGVLGSMNIIQRGEWTMKLHRQYQPLKVGYEHYGLQGDIDYIKKLQQDEGYFFEVIPLTTPKLDKDDRIPWLMPEFKNGDFLIPKSIPKRRVGDEEIDIIKYFIDKEYKVWPATKFKDILDCLSWIKWKDFGASFPEGYDDLSIKRKRLDWDETESGGSWMVS